MVKVEKNSHFEMVNGKNLRSFGDDIVQIDTNMQYTNNNGYGVYICEIRDGESKEQEENKRLKDENEKLKSENENLKNALKNAWKEVIEEVIEEDKPCQMQ